MDFIGRKGSKGEQLYWIMECQSTSLSKYFGIPFESVGIFTKMSDRISQNLHKYDFLWISLCKVLWISLNLSESLRLCLTYRISLNLWESLWLFTKYDSLWSITDSYRVPLKLLVFLNLYEYVYLLQNRSECLRLPLNL